MYMYTQVAFHAARALSLLSSNQANRRLIVEHGGLPIMYMLARQADADIQAEAATVIANVTAASWEAQLLIICICICTYIYTYIHMVYAYVYAYAYAYAYACR